MAEIPVHKKSGGIPWWVWLLIALAVAILLWIWLSNEDDNRVVNQPVATEQVGTVAPVTTGPITTLAAITGGASMADLVGREVVLQGVPVESLAGDQAFFIGDSPTNRAFVVFDEKPTPNTPMEGNVDVNPGSMVSLRGVVRSASETPTGATLPSGTAAYIFASNVDVVS